MRNERLYVMILSYIIGLTTSYIAFGVSSGNPMYGDARVLPSVSLNFPQEIREVKFDPSEGNSLVASVGDRKRLLSIRNENQTEPVPTVHVDVPLRSISPNQHFVFFCEIPTVTTKECVPYVYSSLDDVLHRVKLDGSTVESSSVSEMSYRWAEDNRLVSEKHASVSPLEPWNITTRESLTNIQ